jgi:ParB-like chromosome segregation protein Spo0J
MEVMRSEAMQDEVMRNGGEGGDELVVQKIPLELFAPSEYNSRWCRPSGQVQELIKSLRLYGQREALRVYPGVGDDLGKYMVVSGVTRVMAAKTLGWKALDAIIDPAMDPNDPLTIISLSRQYNEVSKETAMDRAALLDKLENKGYGTDEIMMALGFDTPSKLYKLRSFKALPQAILAIAAQYPDKISAEFAGILKRAVTELGEEKALLLAEELIAKNLSTRKLERRIEVEGRKGGNKPARLTRDRATVVRVGDEKVGDLCLMHHSDPGKRRVKLEITLPEGAATDVFSRLDNLIQEMKEKWQA